MSQLGSQQTTGILLVDAAVPRSAPGGHLVVAPVDLLEVVEAAGVAHRVGYLACQ